jgi:hypothetical protein
VVEGVVVAGVVEGVVEGVVDSGEDVEGVVEVEVVEVEVVEVVEVVVDGPASSAVRAARAAVACGMPAPVRVSTPGVKTSVAEVMRAWRTWAAVASGWASKRIAAIPATRGAAIDVPDHA